MTDFPTYTTEGILKEDMTAKSSILNEDFSYSDASDALVDETQDEIVSGDIMSEVPKYDYQEITKYFSFSHDLVFSSTDSDTVAWTAGTLKLNNGQTFAIGAGNTGNMTAVTYIYFDIRISRVALQTTTSFRTSCGDGKITIAVAQNNAVAGKDATFQVFGGTGGAGVFITADNIAANTITAGEMNVSQLSAISANLGSITAGTVTGVTIIGGTIKTTNVSQPKVQIDTTDGITVFGESLWFAVPAVAPTTVDSNTEASNQNVSIYSTQGYYGQSFACSSSNIIGSVKVRMSKNGSPTGNMVAKIWHHGGTYGTSSKPTTLMATSDNYNVATIGGTEQDVTFTFSGTNFAHIVNGTKYVLTIEYTGGDASNSVYLRRRSVGTHAGNWCSSTDGSSWTADANPDMIFYVYTKNYGEEAGRLYASTTTSTGIKLVSQDKDGIDSGYAITIDSLSNDLWLYGQTIHLYSWQTDGGVISIGPDINVTCLNFEISHGDFTVVDRTTLSGDVDILGYLNLYPQGAPSSPVEGDLYPNSTDHHLYFWNGTAWKQCDN